MYTREIATAAARPHVTSARRRLSANASTVAAASLLLGHPRDDLMDRALALAETVPGPRLGRGPAGVHARHCLWGGRLEEARTILEDLHRAGVQAGIEFQRPYRILDLAVSSRPWEAARMADALAEMGSIAVEPIL